jgi:uncharacterized protein YdgA (DUF945 family)
MRKWFYIFLVVVIIIAALILIPPYFMGREVQKTIASIPSSESFRFAVTEYRRGWFSSDVTIKMMIKNPNGLDLVKIAGGDESSQYLQITVNEHIIHGPVIFTPSKHFMLGQAYILGSINEADMTAKNATLITLNGKIDTTILASQVHFTPPRSNVTTRSQDILAHLQFKPNLQQVRGTIKIAAVTVATPNSQQAFQGIKSTFDLNRSAAGIFVGERELKLDRFSSTQGNDHIDAQNLDLRSRSDEKKGKISTHITGRLEKITVDNGSYGPHVLDINLKDMDANALFAISREAIMMSTQNNLAAQIARSLQLARYNQLLWNLFGRGMQIDLKQLNMATRWGTVNAVAEFNFEPLPGEMGNPIAILQKFKGNLQLLLPQALVKEVALHHFSGNPQIINPQQQADQLIDYWVKNQWLIADGTNYKMDIKYQYKNVLINNKPLNAPAVVSQNTNKAVLPGDLPKTQANPPQPLNAPQPQSAIPQNKAAPPTNMPPSQQFTPVIPQKGQIVVPATVPPAPNQTGPQKTMVQPQAGQPVQPIQNQQK